ncbi:MAG: hypothetical protein H0W53_10835 [Acidobacteria bacterium]|nr:hypothetical protein [Acidobacteriota bacterium]
MSGAGFAAAVACALLCLPPAAPPSQSAAPPRDDAAIEQFLRTARVVRTRTAGKGVTDSTRATLALGEVTHDVHIQTIDKFQREFQSQKGVEFNFRDKWQFNVAAYKIDRLLGLNFVPVTVERRWRTDGASFTWWVDDVLMDEGERLKRNVAPPNQECWNEQMQLVRVFDQLIDNSDRNLGNMVIDRTWRAWAIDHTRAFRRARVPTKPATLTRVDRQVLDRLAALEFASLKREIGRYVEDPDLHMLLARRDGIVAHFRTRGGSALFDRRDLAAGCVAAPAAGF